MVHGKALHLMQHHRVMLVILDAPVGVKLVAILDVDLDALADVQDALDAADVQDLVLEHA